MKRFTTAVLLSLISLSLSGCLGTGGFGDQGATDSPSEGVPSPVLPPTNGLPQEKAAAVATDTMVQVGNRHFVESALKNVFLSPTAVAAVNTQFRTILDATVQKFPGEFGGPLTLYTTLGLKEFNDNQNCGGASCSNDDMLNLPYWMPSTPARTSVMIDACQRLLDATAAPVSDAFLKTAISNVGGTSTVSPSDDLLQDIPDLFAPGIEVGADVHAATIQIREALKTKGVAPLEQWRGVFMAHCQNPYWHTL
jgi:hypothetical protein